MYAIGHYDAPEKNALPANPLHVETRVLCKSRLSALEAVDKIARADVDKFALEVAAPIKFDLADEEDFYAKKETAYHIRWVKELEVSVDGTPQFQTIGLYLIRKKPDGYILSGAVRVQPLRYYFLSPIAPDAADIIADAAEESSTSSTSSSSSSSSSSESEEEEDDEVCPCGKGTVHFHAKNSEELTIPVVANPPPSSWTAASKRRRNRNRRNRK